MSKNYFMRLLNSDGGAPLDLPFHLAADGSLVPDGASTTSGTDPTLKAGFIASCYVKHYNFAPAATGPATVHALIHLTGAPQVITSGILQPDVPRTVTITGNDADLTGNVVITGEDILGAYVIDTIALNGLSTVEGLVAFAKINSITVPAGFGTDVLQQETATIIGTIGTAGNATIIVTAAGMTGSPKTYHVAVAHLDTATQVAGKVITALGADAALTALYTVGGTGATVTLTAKVVAPNDTTLNISSDNDTCTGLTAAPTSVNTTAGEFDKVSIGTGKKFGLTAVVQFADLLLKSYFNGSADAGSLAVDAAVSKCLYNLAGTPNGTTEVDLYYVAS